MKSYLFRPSLLFIIVSFFASAVPGQVIDGWRHDSVYFDRGIPESDSFEPQTRTYYTAYDDQERPTVIIIQRKLPDGAWSNWRRRRLAYTGGELAQVAVDRWENSSELWSPTKVQAYEYDAEGYLLLRLLQLAPSPGAPLENTERWLYDYNPEGQQTGVLYQQWEGNSWQPITRQVWNYNAEGKLTEQLLQNREDSDWVNARRRMWQYGSENGLVSMVQAQVYSGQDWVNTVRKQYYYNNGPVESIREQHWDNDLGTWVNQRQESFVYGPGFEYKSRTLSLWELNEWQAATKLSFGFDGTFMTTYGDQWNEEENDWNRLARYEVAFEDSRRPLLAQGWQFRESEQSNWFNLNGTIRRRHFWSQLATATDQGHPIPQECSVPNPLSLGGFIDCTTLPGEKDYNLRLANIMGQIVYRSSFRGKGSFLLPGFLSPGLYVLEISSAGNLHHLQKLVVTN